MAPDIKVLASRFLIGLLAITAQALANTPMPSQSFFVANEGQWDGAFAFKCEIGNATYFLTSSGFTVDLHSIEPRRGASPEAPGLETLRRGDSGESPPRGVKGHVLRLSYLHANSSPVLIGQDKLSSYSNYFLSRDSCRWRSRVGHYRNVLAQGVWNGIDVEYRTTPEGLETVYHLHPGADPAQIMLRYEGADAPIAVDANGSLLLRTSLGEVKEKAPFAYQIIGHTQQEIPCRFEVLQDQSYRLSLGAHEPTQELVIDPELVYSTYWGHGAGDWCGSVLVDSANNPILSGYDWFGVETTPGAYIDSSMINRGYGYVTKFSVGGDSLLFSTYFPDLPTVYLEPDLSMVIVDQVADTLWPLTPDGFDTTYNGGPKDLGMAKLSADGATLVWGSYWGGSGDEQMGRCSISPEGLLYVTTNTTSDDFPLTEDALYRVREGNGYTLTVFDLRTLTVRFSTYFHAGVQGWPSRPLGVSALPGGKAWLWGDCDTTGVLAVTPDALFPTFVPPFGSFFARLRLQPASIEYASYFGSQVAGAQDYLTQVLPLDSSHLVLTGGGSASHAGFAMPGGGFQSAPRTSFVVKLSLPDSMTAGTYLGGTSGDWVATAAVDAQGGIVASGSTQSDDFPVTANAFQRQHHPGTPYDSGLDWFLVRLSADLTTLRYGTYVGGSDREWFGRMAMRDLTHVWMGGATYSHDYPTTPDALIPSQPSGDYAVLSRFDLRDSADAVEPPSRPIPAGFALSAYPNPFNPTTTLSFMLPSPSLVKLEVFDVLGRTVYQKDLGRLAAGEHRERFEGEELSSGIYFARVQAGSAVKVQKVMLLK